MGETDDRDGHRPVDTGSAEARAAEASIAETGTVETGTVETGTVETGTVETGTVEVGGPPIACSLDASSLSERLDEWRALVATSVSSVELDADSVRLALRDSDDALVAAASLGMRENACCSFFDVAVELEPARRVLRLRVPAGAEAVLAEFVGALRP